MEWNEYRQDIERSIGEYQKLSPGVLTGLHKVSESAQKTALLHPKTRSLIALAVAVTTRCDGCISVHTKNAAERGASREEIAEALGVAISLNAGAALVYSARVLDAYAALGKEETTSAGSDAAREKV